MTHPVVSVVQNCAVNEIVELMVSRSISGVPVVDEDGCVVGVVTEGDLLHRPELGRHELHRGRWLRLLLGAERTAQQYVKSFGLNAADVMTSPAITVDEDTDSGEIARILDERHIKRIPIVRHGRLTGIVSRTDLMRYIVTRRRTPIATDIRDEAIRERLVKTLRHEAWASSRCAWVTVEDGTIHLRGMVETREQVKAFVVAAGNVAGARAVVNHLNVLPHTSSQWD